MDYQASLCPGCHHPRDETYGPDNANKIDADGTWRYEAVTYQCHLCEEKDKAAQRLRQDDNADTAGIYIAAIDHGRPAEPDDDEGDA